MQLIPVTLLNGPNIKLNKAYKKTNTIYHYVYKKLKSIDLIFKIIICDQGTNNQKLINLLEITINESFLILEDEKIYFMYDTTHFIKSVLNNF